MELHEKYEPIEDRVIIEPTPPDKVSGHFELMDKEQEKKSEGTVRAVGPGVPLHNIKLNISGEATVEVLDRVEKLISMIQQGGPMHVSPGDYVLYGRYSGTKVTIDGKEYFIVRQADIFTIVKKN